MQRVTWLFKSITPYMESLPKSKEGIMKARRAISEILRAHIVPLHAILEDGLREIIRLKLYEAPYEALSTIPLVGASPAGQLKKIGPEDLARHRGKTIDTLIKESVDEFLDRTSFSSTQIISGLLEKVGIQLSSLREHFTTLDAMISRRHQIVHRADRIGGLDEWKIPSINPNDVSKWMLTVFVCIIETSILARPAEEQAAMRHIVDEDKNLQEIIKGLRQDLKKPKEADEGTSNLGSSKN